MFERFTAESKAILVEAQDAALDVGAACITPAHLFYGCAHGRARTAGEPLHEYGITGESIFRLLPRSSGSSGASSADSSDIDPQALKAIGIDYERVRRAVNKTFGEGALESSPDRRARAANSRRPPFTTEAKRSLELSLRVALELHERRIRPGHILLGLLRLNDEQISIFVEQQGATVARLSATVLQRLDA
jgi:ATP-dependent Clp protease ATP-binding subunit ClpA